MVGSADAFPKDPIKLLCNLPLEFSSWKTEMAYMACVTRESAGGVRGIGVARYCPRPTVSQVPFGAEDNPVEQVGFS
jgi:hypothetical protein